MEKLEYRETVRAIERRGIMPLEAPSLEKMRVGIARLNPSLELDPRKIIVVAGTNGKGSVCASLEALLLDAGCKVGLYTSPHLEEITERIRINGEDISQEEFCSTYSRVAEITADLCLSHFEILTLMAVWVFYSKQNSRSLDWGLFEVGLGGLWDATNAIPHHHCVITSLGLDHQNLLGNSLQEIAWNKFGIVGQGSTVIHTPFVEEIRPLADQVKNATRSTWIPSIPFQHSILQNRAEPRTLLTTRWGQFPLALMGARAAENSALALTVFHQLGFNPADHLETLLKVRWPGRMEKIRPSSDQQAAIYLSGDHNVPGVRSLIELLSHYSWERLYLICGIGKDKESDPMLELLFSIRNAELFLTETPFKGHTLPEYGPWLQKASEALADPIACFEAANKKAGKSDLILVTGSLYLVGLLRKHIQAAIS